jgi:hypothetical protein
MAHGLPGWNSLQIDGSGLQMDGQMLHRFLLALRHDRLHNSTVREGCGRGSCPPFGVSMH